MHSSTMVSSPIRTTHLIVRCFGLHVPHDTVFKEIGTLSNIFAFATSSNTIRNEKRIVRMSQSVPFKPLGRPSTYIYNPVLESEVFEDQQDISPTAVAAIHCPEDMDCRIQLNVYYSSSRTSGKEILLSGVSFTLMEFRKHSEDKGILKLSMTPDYCIAAKAYIELFIPYPKVFKSLAFSVHAPPKDNNPLRQKYVFYGQDDNTSPRVDVLEMSSEPRLSFVVPLKFIDNIISALNKSMVSWKQRQNLERMRQGYFLDCKEANNYGWHELRVTVHEAKLSVNLRNMSNDKFKNNSFFMLGLSPNQIKIMPHEQDILASSIGFPSDSGNDQSRKIAAHINAAKGTEKPRKLDENLPTSFVKITVIDSTQMFQLPIGKTNTERFNLRPVYGSNVNAPSTKKNVQMIPVTQDVKIEVKPAVYSFNFVESPYNDTSDIVRDGNSNAADGPPQKPPRKGSATATGMDPASDREKIVPGIDAITVHGEIATFVKYIPSKTHTSLQLELYIQDNSGNSEVFGSCSIPLSTLEEKVTWLPLNIAPEYSQQYSAAMIKVGLKLTSPSTSPLFIVSPEFHEIFQYSRETNGEIKELEDYGANLYDDYRYIIPECYSWMWHIGGYDEDVLAVQRHPIQESHLYTSSNHTIAPHADALLSLSESFSKSLPEDKVSNDLSTVKRLDCPLSLQWLEEYISQLESLADYLLDVRTYMSSQIAPTVASTFRPSTQKKDERVQALPINLHYQILATRNHESLQEALDVQGSVTCGSFSPHFLGHKKGGLLIQESELHQLRVNIEELKVEFLSEIRKAGSYGVSRNHPTYDLLHEIGRRYCKYEMLALQVAKRRILALSQGISVAFNACHLKLGLVTEGHLSPLAAEQWIEHGMLLMFEGLLSVIGNEKSMLEDTMSIVDTLNLFSVRLCSIQEDENQLNETAIDESNGNATATDSTKVISNDEATEGEDSVVTHVGDMSDINPDFNYLDSLSTAANASDGTSQSASSVVASLQSSYGNSNYPKDMRKELLNRKISTITNQFEKMNSEVTVESRTKIAVHGRQIVIYVPPETIERLPKACQDLLAEGSPGAVIPIHAVLFSQGIDMQQTVATFTNEASGVNLQYDINIRGLRHLNSYCHMIHPINAGSAFNSSPSMPPLSSLPHTTTVGTSIMPQRSGPAIPVRASSGSNDSRSRNDSGSNIRTFSTTLFPVDDKNIHPMVTDIFKTIVNYKNNVKNIELLAELERVSQFLRGCKITFCKSGKDRTGMVVTFEQARHLSEVYALCPTIDGVIKIANTMRINGTRLLVAEKNIGRKVFSINKLQAQFLPAIYRPPPQICEDILKKDLS